MKFNFKKHKSTNINKLQLVAAPGMPFEYIEAYKSLRTNLKFISKTNGANSFIVTSAVPEESKSNTVINLAVTLADSGNKVIVVDCDLRKPVIRKYLKIPRNRKGVTNIVAGETTLEKAIIKFSDLNIDVLHSGTVPPNPSELLASDEMKRIISELKKEYDYVLLDTPPVSVVTDAAIVGSFVDGAILVIRSKFAATDAIRKAQKTLENVGIKIYGTVITRFNIKKSNKYGKYSYSYGYNYYREYK